MVGWGGVEQRRKKRGEREFEEGKRWEQGRGEEEGQIEKRIERKKRDDANNAARDEAAAIGMRVRHEMQSRLDAADGKSRHATRWRCEVSRSL